MSDDVSRTLQRRVLLTRKHDKRHDPPDLYCPSRTHKGQSLGTDVGRDSLCEQVSKHNYASFRCDTVQSFTYDAIMATVRAGEAVGSACEHLSQQY